MGLESNQRSCSGIRKRAGLGVPSLVFSDSHTLNCRTCRCAGNIQYIYFWNFLPKRVLSVPSKLISKLILCKIFFLYKHIGAAVSHHETDCK